MSASVIPLIGRLTAVEPGSGEPEAIPVTLPAAPVEHIRAEEAGNAEPLGTACSIAEDSLIFPALVCPPLLSRGMRIFAPSQTPDQNPVMAKLCAVATQRRLQCRSYN